MAREGDEGHEETEEAEAAEEVNHSRPEGTVTTCQTCKHWDSRGWTLNRLGSCDRFETGDGSDGQTHINSTNAEGEPNFAYLTTRPDFGCTLHEVRHD